MKSITVTIGIPAYNEEKNIGKLLADITMQHLENITLQKVIVAADGCTDKTVSIAKKATALPMLILDNKERLGLAERLNQISEMSGSDILIVLNADARINDADFITKFIDPIKNKEAHLVSARLIEAQPTTFFESILNISMQIKRLTFYSYKSGNNLYTCYGVARAFSKKLYKKIHYQTSVGEDAYSYLYCVAHNYNYVFAKDAEVYYKLPNNMSDHKNQSIRFIQSKKRNAEMFGEDLVTKEYKYPIILLFFAIVQVFCKYPLHTIAYICVFTYMNIKSIFAATIKNTWEVAASSKTYTI